MLNIKWIGVITEKEIAKYQKMKLPRGAKKLRMPSSMQKLQLKSIPFMVLATVIMYFVLILKSSLAGEWVIFGPCVFVGLLIGVVLLFVHEFLHAIVYPVKAKKYIGIIKPLTFVALCAYPVKRSRFLLMCFIPYILGIVPLILFFLSPNDATVLNAVLWGIAFMGLVSPSVDAYNAMQVLKQVPRDKKVTFCGDDIYFF